MHLTLKMENRWSHGVPTYARAKCEKGKFVLMLMDARTDKPVATATVKDPGLAWEKGDRFDVWQGPRKPSLLHTFEEDIAGSVSVDFKPSMVG
jgi:hypothetical protein